MKIKNSIEQDKIPLLDVWLCNQNYFHCFAMVCILKETVIEGADHSGPGLFLSVVIFFTETVEHLG